MPSSIFAFKLIDGISKCHSLSALFVSSLVELEINFSKYLELSELFELSEFTVNPAFKTAFWFWKLKFEINIFIEKRINIEIIRLIEFIYNVLYLKVPILSPSFCIYYYEMLGNNFLKKFYWINLSK